MWGDKMKKQYLPFILLILLISTVTAVDYEIKRTVSASTINPGGEVIFTYTPGTDVEAYAIDEGIPTGWSIVGDTTAKTRHRFFIDGNQKTYYTWKAPQVTGDYIFDDSLYYGYPDTEFRPFAPITIKVVEGTACTSEVKTCPSGEKVGRNPDNDCNFYECPATNTTTTGGSLPSITGNPTLDLVIWVFIGLFALMFIMRMTKR